MPLPHPGLNRMTQAEKGKVYLVGAGPGDPELLTVKAAALLQSADVIYHDDLVSQQILDLARETALVISVGKRCGAKRITQGEINRKLVESAQRGMSVIRLKSGDPLIFGRAGEEIEALSAERIAYEIVPGVTTACAAAAALGCSLTNRGTSSSVLFLSGHHASEKNPDLSPTRVVYMPGPDLKARASAWLEKGESPDLPCVLISHVSQASQSILRMPLRDLPSAVIPSSPAILLTGWALVNRGQATLSPFPSDASWQVRSPIPPPPHKPEPPS